MQGIRVPANEKGYLPSIREPGSYGRSTFDFVKRYGPNAADQGYWNVCAPDGSSCKLTPDIHTVTEHADGTISVWPSIVTRSWHGWLVAGVWKEHKPHQ